MLAIKFSKMEQILEPREKQFFDFCTWLGQMFLKNATFPKECKIVTFPARSEIVHEGSMLESQT